MSGTYTHGPYSPVVGAALPVVVAAVLVVAGCYRLTGALGYLLYYGWRPLHALWLCEGHGQTFTTTLGMTAAVGLTVPHMIGHSARSGCEPKLPARPA